MVGDARGQLRARVTLRRRPIRSPALVRTDAWMTRGSRASPPRRGSIPVLFALVVGDAFLVVLPSETAVVALGALSAATGSPPWWLIIPVAAAGAVIGDALCYLIGRRVGLDRWRWQREGRTGAAIERVRIALHRRTAVLVFTARYVPFARIAVNLAAGAGRVPLRRYLPAVGRGRRRLGVLQRRDRRGRRQLPPREPAARRRDLDPDRDRARAARRSARRATVSPKRQWLPLTRSEPDTP